MIAINPFYNNSQILRREEDSDSMLVFPLGEGKCSICADDDRSLSIINNALLHEAQGALDETSLRGAERRSNPPTDL